MRKRWLTAVALLLGLGWGTAASSAVDGRAFKPSELAPQYRQWLEEVDLLLRKEERQAFLALREDYQRDGFIQKFWEARDPDPSTSTNEFKGAWYARLDQARHDYGNISEDRARMLLLHGEATRVWKTDCQLSLWPLEVWYYLREERLPGGFFAIFYQPAAGGPYRLWNPSEGEDALQALFRNTGEDQNDAISREPPNRRRGLSALADLGTTGFERTLERLCRGDDRIVIKAYLTVLQEAQLGTLVFTEYPPPPRDTEWLATFLGRSTDLPANAPPPKTAGARPANTSKTAGPAKPAPLAPQYRQWLEEVDLLLKKDERDAFLALKEDYQRDGFIQKFWESRDPYPETPENEFKKTWYARLDEAKRDYGNIKEDRARALLLHGEATRVWKTDCQLTLWPLEIWHYARSARLPADFYLLFYQPGGGGPFRSWSPVDGYDATQALYRSEATQSPRGDSVRVFEEVLQRDCSLQIVLTAFRAVRQESQLGTLAMVEYPPPPRDTEWLATFLGLSTDLAKEAPSLAARLTFGFPERRGNRTLVQGVLEIPRTSIAEARLEGHGVYSLLLTGEVLREGALHESFRYRYDLPAEGLGENVPLVFERALRPGDYNLVLRLDDLTGKRSFREARPLSVPQAAEARPDPTVAAALGAARQSLTEEAALLHLVPPPGETATGGVRVEAKATGATIRKVSFALDGRPLLVKTAPPYSVLLALGPLPTPHTVRAVGLDDLGREVATDELVLNGAPQRFAVHLREPRRGELAARPARSGESLRVRAEVQVPDGQTLDRLEIFLDERRVATLYQPPFSQPLTLPSPLPRYVRALATLADGGTAEDLVLLSAPGYQENLDVPLVEVYAAVRDPQGRPVLDLKPADFRVLDGGAPQRIVRWEKVTDLPVSVALLIDTSASMVKSLPEAQRAALGFLRSTLSPRDRAALIPFSESPRLAVKLTHDLPNLAGALAGLQAERGTALWDSLVYGLHYLQGTQGQRALLLLTDGGDRSSHFSFDEALELARRSGVALYTVGLAVGKLDLDIRRHLTRLAEETGGRSFFPEAASDLADIYSRIQEELRSRYLLVYQPSAPGKPGEYRSVAVQVDRPGTTVEAPRGYYP